MPSILIKLKLGVFDVWFVFEISRHLKYRGRKIQVWYIWAMLVSKTQQDHESKHTIEF